MRAKGISIKNLFVSIPELGFFIHGLRLLFGRAPLVGVQFYVKEHIRFWTHADFLYWYEFLGLSACKYQVSTPIYPFGIDMGKIWPSLFGMQIIHALKQSDGTETNKLIQSADNGIGS